MTRDTVAKICGCGRKHSWIEWRSLPRVGFQIGVDDTETSIAMELRNCTCGSTISTPVPTPDLIALLTDANLASDIPAADVKTCDAIRLFARVYSTAARTVIALLEEQRDEADRRSRLLQKKVIVAETRAADMHRTLLLRDLPKDPPDDEGED